MTSKCSKDDFTELETKMLTSSVVIEEVTELEAWLISRDLATPEVLEFVSQEELDSVDDLKHFFNEVFTVVVVVGSERGKVKPR